jgi:hypothetical protein
LPGAAARLGRMGIVLRSGGKNLAGNERK